MSVHILNRQKKSTLINTQQAHISLCASCTQLQWEALVLEPPAPTEFALVFCNSTGNQQ